MSEDLGIVVDKQELLDITCDIARFPSFSGDETPVATFIRDLLKNAGIDAQLHEVEPGRHQTIATIRGSGEGPSLMLNGHLDIDPLPSGLVLDPWDPHVRGEKLFGAGIANMKAGVAEIIASALAVKRSGARLTGDLVCAFVAGELEGGTGTAAMLDDGVRTDMAIVLEPVLPPGDVVFTQHVGAVQFGVRIQGRAIHAADEDKGRNAVLAARQIMSALVAEFSSDSLSTPALIPGTPRITVGGIVGGRGDGHELTALYEVPDVCTILCDLRYGPEHQIARLEHRLRELTARLAPEVHCDLELEMPLGPQWSGAFRQTMLPLNTAPRREPVETLRRNVKRYTGRPVRAGNRLPDSFYSSDAGLLAAAGITSCWYGAEMGVHGATDRWVDVRSHHQTAQAVAQTALEICTGRTASS